MAIKVKEEDQEERLLHAGDVWQAAAKYCLDFFDNKILIEENDFQHVVALVEILLKG